MSGATELERFGNWTVQMRKGILDLCILGALRHGERYGYALVKELVAVPGIGVSDGSIYPLLSRLKRQGMVTTRLEESSEGPARKYYRLSESGARLADEMAEHFVVMAKGVIGLTETPEQTANKD